MQFILVATPWTQKGPTLWWTGTEWSESREEALPTPDCERFFRECGALPGHRIFGMPVGEPGPVVMRDIAGLGSLEIGAAKPFMLKNKADLVSVPRVPVSNHMRMGKNPIRVEETPQLEIPARITGAKHWAPGSKGVDITGRKPTEGV